MLIVIVIIGILAVALVPRIMSAQYRANDTVRDVKVGQVSTAIDLYKEDKWSYPLAPFDEYIPYLTIAPFSQDFSFVPKKSLLPSVFAATLPPSTVKSLSWKLEWLLTSMPTDPGKGTATYSDGNCIKGWDSFAYYTDVSGKMYAITSLSESNKWNTTTCKWVVDRANDGSYKVVGKGLTEFFPFNPEVDNPVDWCMKNLTDNDVSVLNSLSNLWTKDIWCNGSLWYLSWDDKSLTTLPNAIEKITNTNIKSLYFRRNNLTSLPDLSNLIGVTTINVGDNDISTLPAPSRLPPYLNQLWIYGNNFPTLPDVSTYKNTDGDKITVYFEDAS